MDGEHLHFVTGRLAEHALRGELQRLAAQLGFRYSVEVLPISVAALMTPAWVAPRLTVPPGARRVILPGYCLGDLEPVRVAAGVPVERGPRDLRQLAEYFGRPAEPCDGAHDIQILAEINHAPRLERDELFRMANSLAADGADFIDLGCEPQGCWQQVADSVKLLRDAGLRVSIDSLNPREIEPAVRAGAELVLSVNASNRHAAADWGCEVVAIPDDIATLEGLDATVEQLTAAGVPLRIDPILEPIGCGFAASLGRYLEVRRRYPDSEMLMGVGNLTELTDVDSAGVNVLLLGFCQEIGIRSILTTQVINWARTSVRECDLARRMVHQAVRRGAPPKHLEPRLVALRDPRLERFGETEIAALADRIKDTNYRIFAEDGMLHLINNQVRLQHADPFELFDELVHSGPQGAPPRNLNLAHAFYLGYELAKAVTALTLGKNYRQDQSLDWGYLTVEEPSHRERKRGRNT